MTLAGKHMCTTAEKSVTGDFARGRRDRSGSLWWPVAFEQLGRGGAQQAVNLVGRAVCALTTLALADSSVRKATWRAVSHGFN